MCLGKRLKSLKKGTLKGPLKKELRIFNFQPNEPLLKLDNHAFHKNLNSPGSITYNPCPQFLLVLSTSYALLYELWTISNKKTVSKFLYWMYFGKTRRFGVRDSCPLITSTLKKGTRNYDYQSNEHLRSIYDQPFYKNLI